MTEMRRVPCPSCAAEIEIDPATGLPRGGDVAHFSLPGHGEQAGAAPGDVAPPGTTAEVVLPGAAAPAVAPPAPVSFLDRVDQNLKRMLED